MSTLVIVLAQLLLLRPKFGEKMRIIQPKNSSQNRKNRKNRNFLNFFLYLFLPQTNHFKYRNARSKRPVLEIEGKIQKFVDTKIQRVGKLSYYLIKSKQI